MKKRTPKRPCEPYELTGEALQAYRRGWLDGDVSNYFPCGLSAYHYDWGYKDGQKYGPRKGKPWRLGELLKLAKEMK